MSGKTVLLLFQYSLTVVIIIWCHFTHYVDITFSVHKLCSSIFVHFMIYWYFSVENQQNVGSKAAKKNKKRNSKKSVHRDEEVEKKTVDFNYMLTELKKQLEEAKSTKVEICYIFGHIYCMFWPYFLIQAHSFFDFTL